jgi:RimJ/RimL family protein N-acetyltransferase
MSVNPRSQAAGPTDHHADRPRLSLHPLTAAAAHQIEHWFDHPEVQARLGGRFWIHRELRLIGQRPGDTFRGKTVLRSYGWIGQDRAHTPVAFIGGDVYDRWVHYHGEGPHGPVLSDEDPRITMGLGYVVDPSRWRHGYGRAAIEAVLHHPAVTDAQTFFCGIDADNHASRRCAEAAGFQLVDPHPDHEGMLYYRRERPTRPTPPTATHPPSAQNAPIHNS